VEVELLMNNGQGDQSIQNDQIDILIERQVDALVVNIVDIGAAQSVIDKAKEAGIPVVFFNREPDTDVIKSYDMARFVGTKPKEAGIIQGEMMAEVWKEGDYDRNGDGVMQYVMLKGDADNPEAIARTEYSIKTLNEAGIETEELGLQVANWDNDKANQAMEAWLAKDGDRIEFVIANNDGMASGAVSALQNAGYNTGDPEKYIPVFGVDATEEAINLIERGAMTGTVKQDGEGMAKAVHALMGEDGAGKSTLMKILFGIYKEDAGEIYIDGKKTIFPNPRVALEKGVSMVHQELNQVLQRNVMDNIMLGRYPQRGIFIDHRAMYKFTRDIFNDLGIDIDPRTKLSNLSVSERQMVEIAKAVSYDAKILVLDEPTSSLTEQEVEHLFKIINLLRDRGCGIVYISHKMEEILRISDEVTVLRDGKWVATECAKDLTTDKIISLMVGRDLTNRFPDKSNEPGEVMLEVKNLTGKYQPSVRNAFFQLRKGEILGVAGLVGSRRTELLETIFGIASRSSGEIYLNGELIENKDPTVAVKNGFALLTEERRATGIFGELNVRFNSMIANMDNYSKYGVINNKKTREDTEWVIDNLNVRTPSQDTLIKSLSGGNQQKVVIGRWLLIDPEVLLLDEPTRGVDVGAKYEIYQLIIDLAKRGKGVIFVSSEMPELLGICDRILIMSNGRIAGIEEAKNLDQEKIMSLAAKYL